MSVGGLGFRGTVAAGVVIFLITSALTWLVGFHHKVWLWLVVAFQTLWAALTFPASVPTAVLLVMAGVIYVLWRRAAKARSEQDTPQPRDDLSPNEDLVVRLLVAIEGEWMRFDDIVSRVKLPKLIAEQVLERLVDRDFLFASHSRLYGTTYRLSSVGRDYAIDQGYVK